MRPSGIAEIRIYCSATETFRRRREKYWAECARQIRQRQTCAGLVRPRFASLVHFTPYSHHRRLSPFSFLVSCAFSTTARFLSKMGRGLAWSNIEDVQVCRSWLHVLSHDGRLKAEELWERVGEHFTAERPADAQQRSMRSIRTRWVTAIQKEVLKFTRDYSDVIKSDAAAQKTRAEPDRIEAALNLYLARAENQNSIRSNSFDYMLCWLELKDTSPWKDVVFRKTSSRYMKRKRKKEMMQVHDTAQLLASVPDSLPSPTGLLSSNTAGLECQPEERESGLEPALKSSSQVSSKAVDSPVQHSVADMEVLRQRNKLAAEENVMKLMTMKDEDVPPHARSWIALKRRIIMKELTQEAKALDIDVTSFC